MAKLAYIPPITFAENDVLFILSFLFFFHENTPNLTSFFDVQVHTAVIDIRSSDQAKLDIHRERLRSVSSTPYGYRVPFRAISKGSKALSKNDGSESRKQKTIVMMKIGALFFRRNEKGFTKANLGR